MGKALEINAVNPASKISNTGRLQAFHKCFKTCDQHLRALEMSPDPDSYPHNWLINTKQTQVLCPMSRLQVLNCSNLK